VTEEAPAPAERRWRRELPKALEIALALVLAFSVGRLTVHTSTSPKPGTVDLGFTQDMAVHHEQAVLMADLAQSRGGMAIASVANGILINQSQEIGLMRGWLKLWHRPAADPTPMSWMPMMAGARRSMPGMATPAQLTRLASLTGTRFDVLFLQLMIRHHEGGLQMCQYARDRATLSVVRTAAASMAAEQIEDLGQMRALLRTAEMLHTAEG